MKKTIKKASALILAGACLLSSIGGGQITSQARQNDWTQMKKMKMYGNRNRPDLLRMHIELFILTETSCLREYATGQTRNQADKKSQNGR